MARLKMSGLDDVQLSLQEIANIPRGVQEDMLNAGAAQLIPAQRSKAWEMGVYDTGKMAASIDKTKIKTAKNGALMVQVYAQGTRRRNGRTTTNAEIQFINEYGRRKQKARPFTSAGATAAARAVVQAETAVYDRWLEGHE